MCMGRIDFFCIWKGRHMYRSICTCTCLHENVRLIAVPGSPGQWQFPGNKSPLDSHAQGQPRMLFPATEILKFPNIKGHLMYLHLYTPHTPSSPLHPSHSLLTSTPLTLPPSPLHPSHSLPHNPLPSIHPIFLPSPSLSLPLSPSSSFSFFSCALEQFLMNEPIISIIIANYVW